jgi:hypothetical protein
MAIDGDGPLRVRKRPVEVEAVRLTWPNWNAVCEFVGPEAFEQGAVGGIREPNGEYRWGEAAQPYDGCEIALLVPTREGPMIANEGDWILREPFPTDDRRFYPCKEAIFHSSYEPLG